MASTHPKILLIRLSSFGDVAQSLSIPSKLAEIETTAGRPAEIHWIVRKDLAPLLQGHPHLTKIWQVDRALGLRGLLQLIQELKKEKFTHIYDAHNNLRSLLISCLLRPPWDLSRLTSPPAFIRKSQKRWKRFLLFKMRINKYEMPFSGQRDLLEPLHPWGIGRNLPPAPQIQLQAEASDRVSKLLSLEGFQSFIALAPSAAYPLKRWPLAHFKKLIALAPHEKFVCLGGPEDKFIQELKESAPSQVLNLAGQLSLQESTAAIAFSRGLIANDTGLLHLGEQLGKKTIALMGPAPFGFPSRPTTRILQIDLPCRPCSKHGQGPCINEKFHRCLVDITPEQVKVEMDRWF